MTGIMFALKVTAIFALFAMFIASCIYGCLIKKKEDEIANELALLARQKEFNRIMKITDLDEEPDVVVAVKS